MAEIPADRMAFAMRLLTEAVAAHPRGKAGVAAQLGVCRSLLARTLSPRDTLELSGPLAQRIIDCLHTIPVCPATGEPIAYSDCYRIATGPGPNHNPMKMRIWVCCQTCPNRPEPEENRENQ